jgi:anaerobic magnesium-protoporphyrin IX monomethyl ester cyclase
VRVLLVRPPARHHIETEVPPAVEAENQAWPPLGLLALATWLRKCTSHEVAILDAGLDDLSADQVEARIRENAPEVVGITCFTVGLVDVVETIEAARRCPSVRHVVLGGPHVTDFPALSLGLPGVSAVVKGEGQAPLGALLDAWSQPGVDPKRAATGIPGVMVDPADPVPEEAWISDSLDDYPIIDRSLVDPARFSDVMDGGELFTTVLTSRGCPFRCTFCNTPRYRYRTMSPGRICDEIEACIALGIRRIYFADDTFNITNKRVADLAAEIVRRKIDIAWTVRCRVKGIDEPLLRRMKAAGCTRIQFGVEQGTEEGLLRLKKGVTLDEVENAFQLCRKVGMHTVAYFLVGTPTERTRADVLRTIRYSIRLKPDFVMYNLLTPFPGTPLFEEGVAEGVLRREPWDEFLRRPNPSFKAQVWEQHLSRSDLKKLLGLAYRLFYWRPGFVLRNVAQVHSMSDLRRKATAGLRLLTGR